MSAQERDSSRTLAPSLADRIRDVAFAVRPRIGRHSKAGLSRGDRAVLRRMRLGETPPAVFWELAETHGIGPSEEEFWIQVLPLMVKHSHSRSAAPGKALAQAQVSSARFERWLRLDGPTALRESGRILSQLKGQEVDWGALGTLLRLWDHPKRGDSYRRRIARSFYIRSKADSAPTTPAEGDQ